MEYLLFEVLLINHFDEDFNSYEVEKTGFFEMVNIENLFDSSTKCLLCILKSFSSTPPSPLCSLKIRSYYMDISKSLIKYSNFSKIYARQELPDFKP